MKRLVCQNHGLKKHEVAEWGRMWLQRRLLVANGATGF